MADALSRVSTRRTPQTEKADDRQVKNNAGGYVFKVGDLTRLNRFLTIGTEGGTYYSSEAKLTADNAAVVIRMAKADDPRLLEEIEKISVAGRAPRNNPALFALAVASSLGSESYRSKALAMLPRIARTGSHLLAFVGYAENFRGWGRGFTKAVGRWYTEKSSDDVAYQVLKYKQRGGWSQRDVLRLSHKGRLTLPLGHRAVMDLTMKGQTPDGTRSDDVPRLMRDAAKAHTITSDREMVALIERSRLSWEMLPSEALNSAAVWGALLLNGRMPIGAIIRQLPTLTRRGVLTQFSPGTDYVIKQLSSPEVLKKGRVHPVNLLVALKTYASGRSLRGDSSWTPVSRIIDALDKAFYLSYGTVEPAGKKTLIALDVSGSMGSAAGGLPISCREVSAAVALVTMNTEPEYGIVGFTGGSRWGYGGGGTALTQLDLSPRMRLDDAVRKISGLPFGSTDCALPMMWAKQNKIEGIETFEILTDNETWAGSMHPVQALKEYRQWSGVSSRLQVVALTPTEFSIADPLDPGTIDVSGFDSNVPQLLADHSRGDL